MSEQSLTFSGFFAFFAAYSIVMLVAYRIDPRFSLKQKKATSVEQLLGLSAIERLLLAVLLAAFSLFPMLDVYISFGFNTMLYDLPLETSFGLFFGVSTFVLGMPINALILVFRRRRGILKTEREEKQAQLASASGSRSKAAMVFKLAVASFVIAVLEEIIFRGYLMYYLGVLAPLSVALVVQAFVYFSAYLYQGFYKGLLTLFSGLMFGLTFYLTGSLLAAIIAHVARDSLALTIQFFPRKKG